MQYQGSCHCGSVSFKVDVDLSNPISCNCSYCQKRGAILAFTPAQTFELEKGQESLTEYRFNTKALQHLFCSTCGISPFSTGQMPDGTKTVAINVRCLDGVDLENLNIKKVDGRSR